MVSVHWNNVCWFSFIFPCHKGSLAKAQGCEWVGADDKVLFINQVYRFLYTNLSLTGQTIQCLLSDLPNAAQVPIVCAESEQIGISSE